MSLYDSSLDPLYHDTHFADEILCTQDYVKQALFALKDSATHTSWKDGVEWRGYTLKFPKKRDDYDFWMQKCQNLKTSEPIFSDCEEESCLDISVLFMYNLHAPLRMNVHKRYDVDTNQWEMGWIIEPEQVISFAIPKFLHWMGNTVATVSGKVQWQEILKSTSTFGYSHVFGTLQQFIYNYVSDYIADEEIDIDSHILINSVRYAAQD